MTSPLHVLVYGSIDAAICDLYRFGMHVDALAAHGVELRAMTTFGYGGAAGADSMDEVFAREDLVIDRSQLDWADVIVFRRFYTSQWGCGDCPTVLPTQALIDDHSARSGHRHGEPDRLVRPLFAALHDYPELLRGRAIVYETDDDLLEVQAWNGVSVRVAPERDVLERMIRRADLVTTTTPVLAASLGRYNDAVRVVRNAIDPTWYALDGPEAAAILPGDPRLLYYGKPNRMKDYAVARPAVDALARELPGARRVWLGALNARLGGAPDEVLAAMDEVGPYVDGPRAFARALAATHPDIGLAPLVGDAWDRAKSELHWLEYTMAGAATVATAIPGGGPFDVIRDGVDGVLVRDRADWLPALRRVAGSRDLRDELAGNALERVLAEYTVEARAADWADAYRWAAEHAGRGAAGRIHGLGAIEGAALGAEARRSLAHRQAARARAEAAPALLGALRAGRDACWADEDGADPLVSVVIPVAGDRPALVRTAVAAALAEDHGRLEVLVVGTPADVGLLASLAADAVPGAGPRLRTLVVEDSLTTDGTADPGLSGRLLAAGFDAAAGSWLAPVDPAVVVEPTHVSMLLGVALEHGLELVYGQAVVDAGEASLVLWSWPPVGDDVLTMGSELIARALLRAVPLDPEAWREGTTTAWTLWQDALHAGARVAGIEEPVVRLVLSPEAAAVP